MIAPRLALICALGAASLATAASGQDAPSTAVQTVVVVDGRVVVSDTTAPAQSGLTVAPVRESDAQAVRRDAEDILDAGGPTPLEGPPQPVATFVDVDNVVVENATSRSTACVQVGVVGAKSNCRPPQ